MQTVGLIGGLGTRAGIFYYERIVARLGSGARVIINHADIGRVPPMIAAGDRDGLGTYLGGLANQLFDAGASFVAIPAVAPHLAIDAIGAVARGPMLSILDVIAPAVSGAGPGVGIGQPGRGVEQRVRHSQFWPRRPAQRLADR